MSSNDRPKVAEVAIPRGPRMLLSYLVPEELCDRVSIGCRVMVPLGRNNRRRTGYVVALGVHSESRKLKQISDLQDSAPLFDEVRLELFKFVGTYYHAPLGDVIRCGLPSGFNVSDARMASLTDLGKTRINIDPVLERLKLGGRPVRNLRVPLSRLLKLESQGLLELRYELERARVQARYVSVVSSTGMDPSKPLRQNAAPSQLLELLRDEGPQEVPSLSERIKNHGAAVRRLVQVGAASIERVQVFRDPWRGSDCEPDTPPILTAGQANAVQAIRTSIDESAFKAFLLKGVTGSGKTEVYLHALDYVLQKGLGGIVLVPEIALTPQLSGRFRARFGNQVAVLHSGLTDGERLDQWELIRRGERPCIVGARSAVFAPVPKLGIVVVDEEHDGSFKQEESPRYHGRDLALKLGQLAGCPVVLGSATPSMESIANVERQRMALLPLPTRIGERKLPQVTIVNLTENRPVRPEVLLSQPLLDALSATIERKEQAIIFLNRRGFANCLLCRACGTVPSCPHCSVSLTYHRSRRRLTCHYCGHLTGVPTRCDSCQGAALELVGTGTEQVESVLSEMLPAARIARMDRDTTRGTRLRELLRRFRDREIDVMVGTQMVAKGHDFPNVTLVGVLLAEQMLKLPDFRASERTFQLLTQVAGRAGRHTLPGQVFIQTYDPNHHSLACARTHDVDAFVRHETAQRNLRGFPPFSYLALIRIDAVHPGVAQDAAGEIAQRIRATVSAASMEVDIIGPQLAPLERIKNRTRYQVLLRAKQRSQLHSAVNAVALQEIATPKNARVGVDIDPLNLL